MKNALTIAAVAAMLSAGTFGTASAMPAHAPKAESAVQLAGHRDRDVRHDGNNRLGKQVRRGQIRHILPQRVIVRSLRQRGYRHIRNVSLVRGDYVLIARGYRGTVRLVVDGRTGRVMSRHLIRRSWNQPGFRIQGGNGNFSYSFGIR